MYCWIGYGTEWWQQGDIELHLTENGENSDGTMRDHLAAGWKHCWNSEETLKIHKGTMQGHCEDNKGMLKK